MSGWLDFGEITPGPPEGGGGAPPPQTTVTTASSGGMSMPNWINQRNAKLAGMGLVAGAVVGVVIVPFLANRKIISKSKTWQVASVGAAVATPLVAAYA